MRDATGMASLVGIGFPPNLDTPVPEGPRKRRRPPKRKRWVVMYAEQGRATLPVFSFEAAIGSEIAEAASVIPLSRWTRCTVQREAKR